MGQVVLKLSAAAGRGLRERLLDAGFEDRKDPHAAWAMAGPGVTVAHYASGKLLVQGKGADDFAITYLDESPDAAPASGDPRDVVTGETIGSDETGKGDYFGPLVVAAMCVDPDVALILRTLGARDSKEVADQAAREMADEIEAAWKDRVAVVVIGPERYNEMHAEFGGNLNRLLAWAHATAIAELAAKHGAKRAVVDKFADERLVRDAVRKKGVEITLEQRPRAESHPAVAAASVLARARFLRELKRLGDACGRKLPKGAGTPVDVVAREIFRAEGIEGLRKVAKVHFKTTLKAQGLFG
ncbi:MAG: Ribonuclease HIII [Planctomycetes bacterium]|nr:Ribonuclease HIII [Planctomycetota bacterium]